MNLVKELFLRSEKKLNNKEKDLKFIKNFSKITISKACENVKVARQNVMKGTASEKNIEKVKEEIEKQIANLYLERNK